MDAQRRAEITGWDAQEFSGGFSGLRRLVDREFSGAVTDGTGWLFVFDGRVVGTADADLDAFTEASGTVYKAPHKSLPILFAMREQGGEPRAQYYTNDTPLSEADRKLSQGGFTGYIELSENVLSGDYYVTYTAGESMAAAYVGNSRRLETGDDAFALADDEVGIYTVYEVDLNVREIPTGRSDTNEIATEAAAGSQNTTTEPVPTEEADRNDVGDVETKTATETADVTERTETDNDRETTDRTEAANHTQRSDERENDGGGATEPNDADGSNVAGAVNASSTETERDDAVEEPANLSSSRTRNVTGRETAESDRTDVGSDRTDTESDETDVGSDRTDGSPSTKPSDRNPNNSGHPADDDVFSEEEEWREQRSIPALDPSEASNPASDRSVSNEEGRSKSQPNRSRPQEPGQQRSKQSETATEVNADSVSPDPRSTEQRDAPRSAVSQRATEGPDNRSERIQQLEAALESAESERESVTTERDELAAERDELQSERDDLTSDIDRLETEVSSLREERNRLREELSNAREQLPESERTLSPAEARSGTNLFVRYDSKGGATLTDAHDERADQDELRENLRIEHHTSFETEGLIVDGRPYEEFLRDTIEYGFTRWLVEDLPFEVSGTGNQSVLRDLYDALPEVDRAEIGGAVSIVIREDGEESREQRAFDLVLRDRMGNPLFIADLNDSREPTPEGTLESLVENGGDIAASNDSFAAAFAVTESFFEPGALETASDAVGGGLFSRSKRASFVKLSRKRGYHLCLVEARDGGFHMTVPDL